VSAITPYVKFERVLIPLMLRAGRPNPITNATRINGVPRKKSV
jgi:hypothetical protein